MTISYQGEFVCKFDKIYLYPFDSHTCRVQMYVSGTANDLTLLVSEGFMDNGPSSIGQYDVKGWTLRPQIMMNHNTSMLAMTVELERNLFNIFMVTFLPTILMNIINSFELVITVNIICMMVLASVYISVSSSLPLTATMKNIEIWLLFNLAYPVFVIIINILLQVTNMNISFNIYIYIFRSLK